MAILDTIRAIPPVTRFFTFSTLFFCFLLRGGYVSYGDLLFQPSAFGYFIWIIRFHFKNGDKLNAFSSVVHLIKYSYRFLTSFLVVDTTNMMASLMDVYLFYTFAKHLESRHGKFQSIFPDALWFTLICGTTIHLFSIVGWYFELSFQELFTFFQLGAMPFVSMLSCVIFLWSRFLKNTVINFMGIIPIEGVYLPILQGGLNFLIGVPLGDYCVGILSAYIYLCIQSGTIPIYNLLPGCYSKYNAKLGSRVQRVGGVVQDTQQANYHHDSIWDLGYLKAPAWLYKVLRYPVNYNASYSAFDQLDHKRNAINSLNRRHLKDGFVKLGGRSAVTNGSMSTGVSPTPKDTNTTFRGTGHKLGS